ncbi:MAG: LysR family transcriptional regulator [Bdellovibrionota bacterium]
MQNFLKTAHCSTLTSAAKKIGITLPALSESIKRFESDLGTKLFYRSRSGIMLTPNGKTTLETSRTAFASLLNVESACQNKLSFGGRTITVGCHVVVASYTLPLALQKLAKKIPDFQINIKHGSSRDVQTLVQMGQIDIGIVVNPTSMPDLIIKKLCTDEVNVWSHGQMPSQKLICNSQSFQTQSVMRKWREHPTDIIETESYELIVRLVEKGIGYGIIPERAVHLVGAKLTKHCDLPSYKDSICLIYRPEFGRNQLESEVVKSLSSGILGI